MEQTLQQVKPTQKNSALRAAFPATVPVLTGYLCLGIAYGVLMRTAGYGLGWAVFLSIVCYAGSMEFVTVTLLTSAFDPVQALIMSIVISVALSALAMVLARPLISLFTSEPDVQDFGVTFVLRITPFYALCCFNQIYSGALRGIGNATTPTIIMLCSFVLFRQIYLFVNKTFFGNSFLGMSLAYPMGWIVCSILIVICYRCSAICHPEKREKLKKQNAEG